MSLFRRENDYTSLFFTREDNRTNLFFTPDLAIQYELDATIEITGFSITASGLDYTYSETARVNDTGTVLYFAQGDYTGDEVGLIAEGTRYDNPAVLPTGTIPFTNPNPSSNPGESSTTLNEHPELFGQVFSAMLVNETTRKYGVLVTASDNFSVGAAYTEARLFYRNTNATNVAFFDLNVDTTYNSYWYNIASGTIEFDTKTNSVLTLFDFPYHTFTHNLSVGGETAPFDRRSRWVIQDSSAPYEYGNIDVFSFGIQVSEGGTVADIIGNGIMTAVNTGSFTFLNNAAIVIDNPNADIDWKGIASASLFDDRIDIVKSGTWTNTWYYQINTGSVISVLNGATTVAVSLSNNDQVTIYQPLTGANIVLTYIKDITVAYTPSPPPTSYSVEVTTRGINLPHNVQIKDSGNNNLVTYSQDTNPKIIDLRDVEGVAIYGVGTVTFHVENVNVSFDASYYNDGSFTYSAVEIENYDPSYDENVSGYPNYRVYVGGNPIYTTANDILYFGNYTDTTDLFLNGVANDTFHDFTLSDADFVSPAIYSVDTVIPAQNPSILARYLNNSVTPELVSKLYSQVLPITDITTQQFKTNFGTFYQFDGTTNQLTCRVSLQTALNGSWKVIGDSFLVFQYDPNLIEFVSPTSPTGFYTWDGVNYSDPAGQKTLGISFSNAKAGNFDFIDVVFAVYQSSFITTAITSGAHTSIKDTSGTVLLASNPITFTNTGYFWNGITSFSFTASSITITPSGSWAGINWSYQINGSAPVSVSGATLTVTGLSIINGDVIQVNQPINGDPLTQTASGIVFIPPSPLSNYTVSAPITGFFGGNKTTSPDGQYLIQNDLTTASTTTYRVYTMSTPFDLTTATLTSTSPAAPTLGSRPRGQLVQNDENTSDPFHGRRYWIFENSTTSTIKLYTSTTAWDVSSGTWSTVSLNGTLPRIWFGGFTNNGTTLALVDDTYLKVYTLTIPYDLSTFNPAFPNNTITETTVMGAGNIEPIEEIQWVNGGNYCYAINNAGILALFDTTSSPYDYSLLNSTNRLDLDTTTFAQTGAEWTFRMPSVNVTSGTQGILFSNNGYNVIAN